MEWMDQYLRPFASLPLDWTIDHVAKLLSSWWRLRAKVGTDWQRVTTSSGHLVNAVHVTRLNSATAWATARWKIGSVPTRRTWDVVAGSCDGIRSPLHWTELRTNPLTVLFTDALDNRLLNAFKKKRTKIIKWKEIELIKTKWTLDDWIQNRNACL